MDLWSNNSDLKMALKDHLSIPPGRDGTDTRSIACQVSLSFMPSHEFMDDLSFVTNTELSVFTNVEYILDDILLFLCFLF